MVDAPQKLTRGERLTIDRRRRGERQRAAAARHGVALSRYSRWERDLDPKAPSVRVGTLKAHERCYLMRRRCGKTQEAIAADMGICRYWLNRMELGEADCTDLACYWEA